MDFLMKFLGISHGVDSIWVIIERLTMIFHFMSNSESIYVEKFAYIYIRGGIAREGVLVLLIFFHDIPFTSMF